MQEKTIVPRGGKFADKVPNTVRLATPADIWNEHGQPLGRWVGVLSYVDDSYHIYQVLGPRARHPLLQFIAHKRVFVKAETNHQSNT